MIFVVDMLTCVGVYLLQTDQRIDRLTTKESLRGCSGRNGQ